MRVLRRFFEICSWYWLGRSSIRAWILLALTLGFSLAIIKVSVLINRWNKEFYDALSAFKSELILPLVGWFLLYTALIVVFIVCGSWFKKLLVIVWRENLSTQMETMWLKNANFYRANFGSENLARVKQSEREKHLKQDRRSLGGNLPSAIEQVGVSAADGFDKFTSKIDQDRGIIDNPDQRISEDSFLLVDKSIELIKSLVYNLAKLVAFVYVLLFEVPNTLKFELFGEQVQIQGFCSMSHSFIR